jgi:hypothetical protein
LTTGGLGGAMVYSVMDVIRERVEGDEKLYLFCNHSETSVMGKKKHFSNDEISH